MGAQTQPMGVDCSNPLFSGSALCLNTAAAQTTPTNNPVSTLAIQSGTLPQRDNGSTQLYVDGAGLDQSQRSNTTGRPETLFPPDPITDFQQLARSSTGELLPVFGRDLFLRAPSTFAPGDQLPVPANYVVGPGDEVLVRLWGPETLNSQLTVDTGGSIYIPRVGSIHVAGLRFDELQKQITSQVNRIYRNYQISVSMGRLRSIQIYVVGEARRPGAYTVSSLSTVLNALFAAGGPNIQGSLRHIQLRRTGQSFPEFDLYDLILRGDKSKDIPLQSGDTIFIPPVGAQAALGGSVRHPAIYELKDQSTVQDVLDLAGGFSAIGVRSQLRLERIDSDNTRQAVTLDLDASSRAMPLRDGDVLFADHISPAFEKTVTIRGNLANPGRFTWHPGMRLSEIIPDRKALLSNDYWRERNRLGIPTPLFEPLRYGIVRQGLNGASQGAGTVAQGIPSNSVPGAVVSTPYGTEEILPALNPSALPDATAVNAGRTTLFANSAASANAPVPSSAAAGSTGAAETTAETPGQTAYDSPSGQTPLGQTYGQARPQNRIQIPAPEIDWSYAVIERLDPNTLKSTLIPFNLGRLVQDHDPAQNLELQPGDVVTILSQADVLTASRTQTKFIRLEGEFVSAGTYSVGPDETLDQVIARAGGLTPQAYLYGSSFLRESARVFQQQRLDEYISQLSTDMERSTAVRAASSSTGILDPTALAEERSLVAQLRQMRATGRVVLELRPDSSGITSIPDLPLENGDIFRVPSRPSTVSVVGAVYGQNVFLYNPDRRLQDYIALAGKPNRVADPKHAFIIRADGSILSRERAQTTFSNYFDHAHIYPGDAIVVPEKLIRPTVLKQLTDYSQILSSFGLAAAAINVVR